MKYDTSLSEPSRRSISFLHSIFSIHMDSPVIATGSFATLPLFIFLCLITAILFHAMSSWWKTEGENCPFSLNSAFCFSSKNYKLQKSGLLNGLTVSMKEWSAEETEWKWRQGREQCNSSNSKEPCILHCLMSNMASVQTSVMSEAWQSLPPIVTSFHEWDVLFCFI